MSKAETEERLYGQTKFDQELVSALAKYTESNDIARLGKIVGSKIAKEKDLNPSFQNMVGLIMRGISDPGLYSKEKIRAMSSIAKYPAMNYEEARGFESLYYIKEQHGFVRSYFSTLLNVMNLFNSFISNYPELSEEDRKKISEVMDGFMYSEEKLTGAKKSLEGVFRRQAKKRKKQELKIEEKLPVNTEAGSTKITAEDKEDKTTSEATEETDEKGEGKKTTPKAKATPTKAKKEIEEATEETDGKK